MKSSNEMVNCLYERREQYVAEQTTKRKSTMKIVASVFSLCLVAVTGFGVWQSGALRSEPMQTNDTPRTVQATDHNDQAKHTQTPDVSTLPNDSIQQNIQSSDGDITCVDGSGNDYNVGGFMIPFPPQNNNIMFTGEKITDEEAAAYFSENYISIVSAFSASGVSAENIKISEHGYWHISYDGTEGKDFEVRQNFRDYLVYNGNRLIAIITLTKENGIISNTPSFGAPWFDNYNEYLQKHAGQELIYVYASNMEIIIAPDESYVNPMGYDVSAYLNWIENPYEWFYNENVVFIP